MSLAHLLIVVDYINCSSIIQYNEGVQFNSLSDAEVVFNNILNKSKCTDVECLAKADANDILNLGDYMTI